MEDIVVSRQRYPRHNVPVRRRNKKNTGTSNTYVERMMIKILVCIVILVVVGIIKSVNTPVTKFMCEKMKAVLLQDIDLKSEYKSINDFFKKTAGNVSEKPVKNVPVSKESAVKNTTDNTGVKKEANSGANTKEDFIAPIVGAVTSPFGLRTDPFSESQQLHSGVDIGANKGDKIKAAADGEVITVGVSKVYGNYLKIKHNSGLITLYAHCSKVIAVKGQKVKEGDIIAEVGSTGASTGSHLHFEVLKGGKAVNPIDYVNISG